jgi:streptogramin lyase
VTPYRIDGRIDDFAFGGGKLWVMDAINARITRIDLRNRSQESRSPNQNATLSSIAFEGGYLWATDDTAGFVWRVSSVWSMRSIAVGSGPDDVVCADGEVWVANHGAESVSKVNPTLLVPAVRYHVGIHPRAVAVANGKSWVVGDISTLDI